jgi:hypothetical protein
MCHVLNIMQVIVFLFFIPVYFLTGTLFYIYPNLYYALDTMDCQPAQ